MLEIRDLSFAVTEDERKKEIIHDLNLTVENGKFTVITGPNGSGKSTLAQDLLRLAAGKNLSISSACEYLSEVGLCARDYIDREINSSLSGGELKRIEIATLLARHTKLSLFDEPEAGIDLWSFQNLIRIFEKMRSEIQDSSILIISHQERILQIADEIVVLSDGQISRRGSPEEVLPMLIGQTAPVSACQRLQ